MNILDNIKAIKSLDKSNVLDSIKALPNQCEQAWEETKKITIDESYRDINNIAAFGMGGSGLGLHVTQVLFRDKLPFPFLVINDYFVPAFVNKKTLVVLSSNSGKTEEVLAAGKEARKRGAKIIGMTTNGELEKFLLSNYYPAYIFKQTHNPSGQPRMGNGYLIFGLIAFLERIGILKISEKEVKETINFQRGKIKEWGVEKKHSENLCKQLAWLSKDKIVCLVGSDFLLGSVHVINNQLNENAKNFSNYFALPEINHHLMEGLQFPKKNPQNLIFLFFNSHLYSKRIRQRFRLTIDVVKKNNIKAKEINLKGNSKLTQVLELMVLGSYFNFYLAMLNNINPAPIPWVDYFKKELNKLPDDQ